MTKYKQQKVLKLITQIFRELKSTRYFSRMQIVYNLLSLLRTYIQAGR